jgi:hypothetical protein
MSVYGMVCCRHAEWPDFVMDMPFDPVCAVPVSQPTPSPARPSGGGSAGPLPSESAKPPSANVAPPPPPPDDREFEEDEFEEEEEVDEESEYETDDDTNHPIAAVPAAVVSVKPPPPPAPQTGDDDASEYTDDEAEDVESESDVVLPQSQPASLKPPVVVLPSLLTPAPAPALASVVVVPSGDSDSEINDQAKHQDQDDEPPSSAVDPLEGGESDHESDGEFGRDADDEILPSGWMTQSSIPAPSPKSSIATSSAIIGAVLPPSPTLSAEKSSTNMPLFDAKDDGFDTLPVDTTLLQPNSVFDDSFSDAISQRRGSQASSRVSIRFGKPDSPASAAERQSSRRSASAARNTAPLPASAVVESKPPPLPSVTLNLSDKRMEEIEAAITAHDPVSGHLTRLILSGCTDLLLSSLHQLTPNLCDLTELVLSRCNLGAISSQLKDPNWLRFAPGITTLDLSDNGLTFIPNLELHRQLCALNLSKNSVKVVGGLEALAQLAELDVSYNNIKSLLSLRTLSLNTNLRSLVIKPNPLTQLDR